MRKGLILHYVGLRQLAFITPPPVLQALIVYRMQFLQVIAHDTRPCTFSWLLGFLIVVLNKAEARGKPSHVVPD